MNWSIRARLTAWYSAVVVTVLVAGAIAVALVSDRLGLARLDGELHRLMLTLEGVMRTEFNEGLSLQAAADEASSEVVAPDRTLMLATPDGTRLAVWGLPIAAPWHPPVDAPMTIETATLDGTDVRILSEPVEYKGHHYQATIIAPLTGLSRERGQLQRALSIAVLIALAIAALGGWVVGRQTLRPLSDMAGQATAITERNPSGRLTVANTDDELGRLAQAFNAVLDRLATALHAQRQFMADASHEVRTPVSVVRTTAQVTLARAGRPERDYREALTIVAEQAARLARLVDAMFLLSRAEAQGMPLVREPLYLDDIAAECVRALRVFADERSVTVAIEGDTEVAMSGDDTLLRQMIGNVVENAIRHAKPGGSVTIELRRDPASATLRVRDDGEGVPAEDRERIFERFVRRDSRAGGAGLGLPIARRVANAHGGELVLEPDSANGACFTVTLPLA
ncbi:MAG TPA: HAMP domain-containing sensor histidine kinase [Vicinamibacterales bacterium]